MTHPCRHCQREYEKQWRADFCKYDVCKKLRKKEEKMTQNSNTCKYCKKVYPAKHAAYLCRFEVCKLWHRKVYNPYNPNRTYEKVFRNPQKLKELEALKDTPISILAKHFKVDRDSIRHQLKKMGISFPHSKRMGRV